MGAEAVKESLAKVDLRKLAHELEHQLDATKSKQIRKKIAKRLKGIGRFSIRLRIVLITIVIEIIYLFGYRIGSRY